MANQRELENFHFVLLFCRSVALHPWVICVHRWFCPLSFDHQGLHAAQQSLVAENRKKKKVSAIMMKLGTPKSKEGVTHQCSFIIIMHKWSNYYLQVLTGTGGLSHPVLLCGSYSQDVCTGSYNPHTITVICCSHCHHQCHSGRMAVIRRTLLLSLHQTITLPDPSPVWCWCQVSDSHDTQIPHCFLHLPNVPLQPVRLVPSQGIAADHQVHGQTGVCDKRHHLTAVQLLCLFSIDLRC